MGWRFWIVTVPARAVDWWFTFYWTLITVVAVLAFATVFLGLLLDRFGIRWGW